MTRMDQKRPPVQGQQSGPGKAANNGVGVRRLLEQERAEYALKCIDEVKGDQKVGPKYKIYVHRLPTMVQVNGLGQALTQIASDLGGADAPAARRLLGDLRGWLIDRRHIYPDDPKGTDLLHALMAGDRATYLRAYEETIELCNWLKKLADAYIESPKELPRND